MFGEPGKDWTKSGFDEFAINLGQEGEINLQKRYKNKDLEN